jgi:stage II sporulation protein AB (anti-sigma F factor)
MENLDNRVALEFTAKSENEGLARMAVAAFVVSLNPSLEEMSDLKTAVSEAVTNGVIHAYGAGEGIIKLELERRGHEIFIDIYDEGCGIADIEKAKEPMFTTREDQDRSGMGFMFMEMFTDKLIVESTPGAGTHVHMQKCIGKNPYL